MNVQRLAGGVVCMALCLVANQAWAQRGGGMMGGANNLTGILRMEEVQKELGLEGENLEKVKAFVEEASTALREKFTALREEGLDREQMMAAMQKLQAEMAEKETKELGSLLTPEQLKRANQLLVQRLGAAAITRPDVVQAIGLSEDEVKSLKDKIAALDKTRNDKIREAMENQDREAMQEINTEYRKNLETLVNDTLTAEQKKALEEFKGAAFKFPEPQRGPGGGGGRRNDF